MPLLGCHPPPRCPRCSDATMRRYIKSGALPAVLVARRFLVNEDDLAKFMRQGKRIASPKAAGTTAPTA